MKNFINQFLILHNYKKNFNFNTNTKINHIIPNFKMLETPPQAMRYFYNLYIIILSIYSVYYIINIIYTALINIKIN